MDGPRTKRTQAAPAVRRRGARQTAPERARLDPEEMRLLPRPARSLLMRLAAEVARLEAELAAARGEAAELAARAAEDPLTGLANRRGFEAELARALSYVQRYGACAALFYVDLDGFKGLNDRFGHAAGDAVLVAVAHALAAHVRASDRVARLGGDEFALMLWNIAPEAAERKAHALEDLIAALPEGKGVLGASVGLTMLGAGDTAAAAEARADRAMYARKAARKGGR